MAFVHGSGATVSLNGTAITAYMGQAGMKRMKELAETRVFGGTAVGRVASPILDSSFTLSGEYSGVAAEIDSVLNTAFISSSSVTLIYTPASGGSVYTTPIHVGEYGVDAGTTDTVKWSASCSQAAACVRT